MNISGWGRYPAIDANLYNFESEDELLAHLKVSHDYAARGLGRSYGDSSLARHIITSSRYRSFLRFDEQSGILSCESGVHLAEIINCFLPRGWFLAITPGTKYVTIGGAIASDVHGKNHHHDGCFSECVESMKVMQANGEIARCSKNENAELFYATCGGMGLTGIILEASIQLIPVKSAYIDQTTIKAGNLAEIFDLFEDNINSKYSVAWLDCLATGQHLGRSLFMTGEHSSKNDLGLDKKKYKSIPIDMPGFTLNQYTVKAFNLLYYNRIMGKKKEDTVHLNTFFYPLDNILHWNRLYGKKGFAQYQCVIPKEASQEGMAELLKYISNKKKGSFLSVLKLLGKENRNWLSFPREGYTLALDFKMDSSLLEFLSELDKIVSDYEGRIYLTKDSRMSAGFFKNSYPDLGKFTKFRKETGASKKFNSLQSKRLGL